MDKITFEDLLTARPFQHTPGGEPPGTVCFFKDGAVVALSEKLDFADDKARNFAKTLLKMGKSTRR